MLKTTSPTPVRIKIIILNPADSWNFLAQPQNLTNIKIPSNTIKKVNSPFPQIPGAAGPDEPNNANTFFPPLSLLLLKILYYLNITKTRELSTRWVRHIQAHSLSYQVVILYTKLISCLKNIIFDKNSVSTTKTMNLLCRNSCKALQAIII